MIKKKDKFTKVEKVIPDAKLTNVEVPKERLSISFKYYDSSITSLSDLQGRKELKALDDFIDKINNYESVETACKLGTCKKTNLDNKRWDLKQKLRNKNISTQIDIIHLRAGKQFRVHGFFNGPRFKLVWLDPNHEID